MRHVTWPLARIRSCRQHMQREGRIIFALFGPSFCGPYGPLGPAPYFFCGDRVCERRALDARARGACDPIDFNIFYHRMIELLEKEEDICLDQPTRRTGPDEA